MPPSPEAAFHGPRFVRRAGNGLGSPNRIFGFLSDEAIFFVTIIATNDIGVSLRKRKRSPAQRTSLHPCSLRQLDHIPGEASTIRTFFVQGLQHFSRASLALLSSSLLRRLCEQVCEKVRTPLRDLNPLTQQLIATTEAATLERVVKSVYSYSIHARKR